MAKIDALVDTSITGGGKTQVRKTHIRNHATSLTVNWIAETDSFELLLYKDGFEKTENYKDFNKVIEKYNNIVANPHHEISNFLNS